MIWDTTFIINLLATHSRIARSEKQIARFDWLSGHIFTSQVGKGTRKPNYNNRRPTQGILPRNPDMKIWLMMDSIWEQSDCRRREWAIAKQSSFDDVKNAQICEIAT